VGGLVDQKNVIGDFITSKTEYTKEDLAGSSYVFGASGSANTCELPEIVGASATPSESQCRTGRVITISSLVPVMTINISTVATTQKIWAGGAARDSLVLQAGEFVSLYAMYNEAGSFHHWITVNGNFSTAEA